MGKNTGFLDYCRAADPAVSPQERVKNYLEFHHELDPSARREQAARCMNCGVSFCQSGVELGRSVSGCPLHNLIPEWNDEIYRGNWEQALVRLCKTNNFPEFTGRVCPALCEAACTCGLYDSPVTVRENELSVIEEGFRSGAMQPRIPAVRSGKQVAVIGSGPAGLAAADQLNQRGHLVTVFERDDRPGGLLMYGIPNMKLDKRVVRRRIELMEAEGVVFRTGADVGKTADAAAIVNDYDAVILCGGAREPREMDFPGRNAQGVCYALDYLTAATRSYLGERGENPLDARGKHVVLIGAGDTGNDCVGTAIRQGCASLTQLVRKSLEEVQPKQAPWPRGAAARNEYGQEEALAVFGEDPHRYCTTVKEALTDEHSRLTALKIVRSEPVKAEDGRTRMREIPESETVLPCELLVIASGFSGCEASLADAFGVELSERGTVVTQTDGYASSRPGIFAAGDVRRGSSLVVWAISEGRRCAWEVDEYLMGYSNMLC